MHSKPSTKPCMLDDSDVSLLRNRGNAPAVSPSSSRSSRTSRTPSPVPRLRAVSSTAIWCFCPSPPWAVDDVLSTVFAGLPAMLLRSSPLREMYSGNGVSG